MSTSKRKFTYLKKASIFAGINLRGFRSFCQNLQNVKMYTLVILVLAFSIFEGFCSNKVFPRSCRGLFLHREKIYFWQSAKISSRKIFTSVVNREFLCHEIYFFRHGLPAKSAKLYACENIYFFPV